MKQANINGVVCEAFAKIDDTGCLIEWGGKARFDVADMYEIPTDKPIGYIGFLMHSHKKRQFRILKLILNLWLFILKVLKYIEVKQ